MQTTDTMPANDSQAPVSSSVTTTLRYLARHEKYQTEKPYTCLMDVTDIPNAASTNIVTVDVPNVMVKNVRILPSEEQPTLSEHGFEVVELASLPDHGMFEDPDRITKEFYPRAACIAKSRTGATEAKVFEHQVSIANGIRGTVARLIR
jgi:hypothetical protein